MMSFLIIKKTMFREYENKRFLIIKNKQNEL